MKELIQQNPALRAALEREDCIRRLPYLNLPETICGIEVAPLTLRHVILLESIRSPFVVGGAVTPYDVGAFFLVITGSPKGFRRWRLLRRVGGLNGADAIAGIQEYLDEAFMDGPPESKDEDLRYYSNAAASVDIFGSQYGWSRETTLNSPLKALFQELRAMTVRANPTAVLQNRMSGKEHAASLAKATEFLKANRN